MERNPKVLNHQSDSIKTKIRHAGASIDATLNRPFDLISSRPLESLGVALAFGLLSGKFPSATRNLLESFVSHSLKR
jgi:hypothetical protein